MKIFSNNIVRWLSWGLLASLFAASCLVLANWQLDRRAEAVAKVTRVAENYGALLPADVNPFISNSEEVKAYEWSNFQITGSYLPNEQLLVRNRPIAGQPGFLQLVPFQTTSGEIVLIERGWILASSDLSPSSEFVPSDSQKVLVGRIRIGELSPNRNSPAGQITSINLNDIQSSFVSGLETKFYLRLVSEDPQEQRYPQPLGKPIIDEGNHLSYAVQWVIFAVMAFFAHFWAMRQEREFKRAAKDPSYVPKNKRRSSKDADVEDEILDRIS